jgi:hypothetical protein
MLAAVHLENLLFLLFILVAFLFQVLTRAATKAGKGHGETGRPSPTGPPPVPRRQTETDEERIRKFLEALGQPAGSAPPLPVTPRKLDVARAAAEARYRLEQERRALERKAKTFAPQPGFPPVTTFPPPLPHELKPTEQATSPPGRKIYRPKVPEVPTFEVQVAPTPAEVISVTKTPDQPSVVQLATPVIQSEKNFAELLKSNSGLREAIILREIFGPPRAFSDLTI